MRTDDPNYADAYYEEREIEKMNNLIKLENGEYGLVQDTVNTIVEIEKQIKKLKEIQDNYKETLLNAMEENNVVKIDVPELTVTRKAPTIRETLDSKALKEELPDIYDSFVKFSDVKGSITIKIK